MAIKQEKIKMKNIISKLIKDDKRGAGGLRKFIISMIFVVGFSFLLLLFIGNFLKATNPTSPLLTDNSYGLNASMNSLNATMSSFTSTVNETQYTLQHSSPSPTSYLFLIFEGAFFIPWTMLKFVGSGVGSISTLLFSMMGKSLIWAIIIPLVIGGITITGVFLIVKAIRTGETEY
jgi:hypothetical protein